MCCAAPGTLFDTIVRSGEYIPVDTYLYLMRPLFKAVLLVLLERHRTLSALSYQAYHVRLVCISLILSVLPALSKYVAQLSNRAIWRSQRECVDIEWHNPSK